MALLPAKHNSNLKKKKKKQCKGMTSICDTFTHLKFKYVNRYGRV